MCIRDRARTTASVVVGTTASVVVGTRASVVVGTTASVVVGTTASVVVIVVVVVISIVLEGVEVTQSFISVIYIFPGRAANRRNTIMEKVKKKHFIKEI